MRHRSARIHRSVGAARTVAAATACALLTAFLGGCAAGPETVPLDCRVLGAEGGTGGPAADTLQVRILLDRLPESGRGRLMVRVDPLAEPGAVAFQPGVPPTSAAASATLTPAAVFYGCFGPEPSGFELTAEEAPIGRIWVRVSSDRPVRARVLHTGDPTADRTRPMATDGRPPGLDRPEAPGAGETPSIAEVVVIPGASAEASWRTPEGSR